MTTTGVCKTCNQFTTWEIDTATKLPVCVECNCYNTGPGDSLIPCEPPCGPDRCTRRGGLLTLCRLDFDHSAQEANPVTVPADWYIMVGITDGADSFPCLKCGATVHPWFTRCEKCGTAEPATPPAPATWTCNECGTSDHETEIDAERCCSPFYCADCGYDRHDLREACECPPVCEGCDREVTVTETECSAANWRMTLFLSDADYPVAIYSACYGGTYCRACYIGKGGDWGDNCGHCGELAVTDNECSACGADVYD